MISIIYKLSEKYFMRTIVVQRLKKNGHNWPFLTTMSIRFSITLNINIQYKI